MIGRQLLHYEITGLLGKGGMGEVYRARDTRLGRDVALKILPEGTAGNPARLSRFEREAKLVAGLNHPNIVTLHSVDLDRGVNFLTMELVEGRTLGELIPEAGMELAEILDLGAQIAEALDVAHGQGVVHRDLKPGNVMVSDRDRRVKVLDFGLAKLGNEPESLPDDVEALTTTTPGAVLGTPSCMSPEQARGEEVDSRSDLFALGVILYRLATGRQPFSGKTPIEWISSILKDHPEPVTRLRPDIPVVLSDLIGTCLRKDPDERPPTARVVLETLRALAADPDGKTITHGPEAGLPRAATSRGLSRRSVGFALLALALVAGVTWYLTRAADPSGSGTGDPRLAVLPFENMGHGEDDFLADGVTDEITSRLAVIQGLAVISRTSTRSYGGSTKSSQEIGRELGTDYILEGAIQWNRAQGSDEVRISSRLIRVEDDTYVWSDSYLGAASEIFALQGEIAGRIAEALDVTLLAAERQALNHEPTANLDAYQAYLQGMEQLLAPGFSEESFHLGIRMFERATELDPGFALAWARLSSLHSRFYHYGFDRTADRLARARSAVDRALALQPDLPEALVALAHYRYWGTRDYPGALEALEKARRRAPGMEEILLITAYVQRRQGNFAGALENLERYSRLSPRDPNAFVGLGETYGTLRRFAEAEEAYQRARDLQPSDSYPYTEMGLLHLRWRADAAAARRQLELIPTVGNSEVCRLQYLVSLFEGDFSGAASGLETCDGEVLEAGAFYTPLDLLRGMAWRLAGRKEDARAAFAGALAHLEPRTAAFADDHRLHAALGLALAGVERQEEALREGARAVALYPLDRDALEAPVPLINLALIQTITGRHEEALANLDTLLSRPSIMTTAWLKGDPRWRDLWDHPGFQELIREHDQTP